MDAQTPRGPPSLLAERVMRAETTHGKHCGFLKFLALCRVDGTRTVDMIKRERASVVRQSFQSNKGIAMQNDKEFLGDLFNDMGQSMSDGLALNKSVNDALKKVCAHRWDIIAEYVGHNADGTRFQCRTCEEVREVMGDEETPRWLQPWNDDLNPQ